jgi:hypothetical protein
MTTLNDAWDDNAFDDARDDSSYLVGNRQGQGGTGSTAGAAGIGRVSTGSVEGHVGGADGGNHDVVEGDLRLCAADDLRGLNVSVDFNLRGGNDIGSGHGEKIALLNLCERYGGRRESGNAWRGARASAQRIQGIAALQHKHGDQQGTERPEVSGNSFHKAILHLLRAREAGGMLPRFGVGKGRVGASGILDWAKILRGKERRSG